jgi:hypothetical protein
MRSAFGRLEDRRVDLTDFGRLCRVCGRLGFRAGNRSEDARRGRAASRLDDDARASPSTRRFPGLVTADGVGRQTPEFRPTLTRGLPREPKGPGTRYDCPKAGVLPPLAPRAGGLFGTYGKGQKESIVGGVNDVKEPTTR